MFHIGIPIPVRAGHTRRLSVQSAHLPKRIPIDETVTMPETTDLPADTPANDPVTMLFQSSPLGNVDAIVQHDLSLIHI